jgi:hypothetical protein
MRWITTAAIGAAAGASTGIASAIITIWRSTAHGSTINGDTISTTGTSASEPNAASRQGRRQADQAQ